MSEGQGKTLLVLNISPQVEDAMVDYLLAQSAVSGFTSYPVRGHGEHSHLSIAEQVSGRRKRIQFEIIMAALEVDSLLGGLTENVGKGIAYWQLPVSNFGRSGEEL
jgi:Protein of unknown function (DUF3240).